MQMLLLLVYNNFNCLKPMLLFIATVGGVLFHATSSLTPNLHQSRYWGARSFSVTNIPECGSALPAHLVASYPPPLVINVRTSLIVTMVFKIAHCVEAAVPARLCHDIFRHVHWMQQLYLLPGNNLNATESPIVKNIGNCNALERESSLQVTRYQV
jgi:hypothetical protein